MVRWFAKIFIVNSAYSKNRDLACRIKQINGVFEISDPNNPYVDTLSSFVNLVNFAYLKGEDNFSFGAQMDNEIIWKTTFRISYSETPYFGTLLISKDKSITAV